MTITQTSKLDIVKEVIDIIHDCQDDGMEMMISMAVSNHLKAVHDMDRSDAAMLLVGAELIDELGLLK